MRKTTANTFARIKRRRPHDGPRVGYGGEALRAIEVKAEVLMRTLSVAQTDFNADGVFAYCETRYRQWTCPVPCGCQFEIDLRIIGQRSRDLGNG